MLSKSLRKGPPKIENNRTIELDRFLGTSALHAHGKPKEAAMPSCARSSQRPLSLGLGCGLDIVHC
jgi:hypothetical protein